MNDLSKQFEELLNSKKSYFDFVIKECKNKKVYLFGVNPRDVKITNDKFNKEIYQKDKFDVILIHHVIEHVEEPINFIHEIKNILKNDGILILGTPNFDSGCARRFNGNYRLLNDPTHISLFSNDSMHRLLRNHNFDIKRVHYPYFETEYFSEENLYKLFNVDDMSPPFYGNFMTFFCKNIK